MKDCPMTETDELAEIAADECVIRYASCGDGFPLLLLHGYPQTHLVWRLLAPMLADSFKVIMPDLPGYGRSVGPKPDPDHLNYSKRHIAGLLVQFMAALGHDRFHLAGHDRGGRVAYRMCLDHPTVVEKFAAIDIVPTIDVWEAMDGKTALATHHWCFLATPPPVPERLIGADPRLYIGHLLDSWAGRKDALQPEAREAYIEQFFSEQVIAATCEDYRAGATIDWELDKIDRDTAKKITCPTTVIWGTGYLSNMAKSPLDVWRRWCENVTETPIRCGHFVPEEAPAECAQAMRGFFLAE